MPANNSIRNSTTNETDRNHRRPSNMHRHGATIAILLISTLAFALPVIANFIDDDTIYPPQTKHVDEDQHHRHPQHRRHLLATANNYCEGTLYRSLCVSSVLGVPNLVSKPVSGIISAVLDQTIGKVKRAVSLCAKAALKVDARQRIAVNDCVELLDFTNDELSVAVGALAHLGTNGNFIDVQVELSAAMTNQDTCLVGFEDTGASNSSIRASIAANLQQVSQLVSNALAMSRKFVQVAVESKVNAGVAVNKPKSTLLGRFASVVTGTVPGWLTRKDRKLLDAPVTSIKFDVVVAKDGTGNFTTIGEAVEAAPKKCNKRFVIYIKAGGYYENVEVKKNKRNLMFVGDGMWKTVVKAKRSVVDGWTTFRSATVAVSGEGFIARDMTFQNYAGPSKHQAVALRSSADLSAFYRCSFAGYQDTLYVHSLRQFYRECDIYGTVDFIFGDAAAVLQNCNIYPRKPDPKQKNIITAQGRKDPNQVTGISIQNCKITPSADLVPVQSAFKTYLGRPWKEFSRTVFMNTYLDSLIEPAGWLEWSGDFALKTLYYGEYKNWGPGSNTSMRVKWPGYKVITNASEAEHFTPATFLEGDEWLPGTSFPFASGLF